MAKKSQAAWKNRKITFGRALDGAECAPARRFFALFSHFAQNVRLWPVGVNQLKTIGTHRFCLVEIFFALQRLPAPSRII
ncbi:hypothetical protein [Rhizobium sp. CCGE 510]|uniref:hypothetical protein n=1 Tax=Rhizobium sp. CCGE 510 TaxID=1132836 RepID=UPI00027B8BBE|nr:hypothetical protein [Rhizobium sp. CCGE 510]EJT06884.1 hypothetical protein RCCGE510_01976 [Rhizobium sp. CCGE 510]